MHILNRLLQCLLTQVVMPTCFMFKRLQNCGGATSVCPIQTLQSSWFSQLFPLPGACQSLFWTRGDLVASWANLSSWFLHWRFEPKFALMTSSRPLSPLRQTHHWHHPERGPKEPPPESPHSHPAGDVCVTSGTGQGPHGSHARGVWIQISVIISVFTIQADVLWALRDSIQKNTFCWHWHLDKKWTVCINEFTFLSINF